MSTASVFTAAVEALNRGHGEEHKRANEWLTNFKFDPDSWATLVELIGNGGNNDVLFHAANIANSKAKNEWQKMNEHDKHRLTVVLRCVHATRSGLLVLRSRHACAAGHSLHREWEHPAATQLSPSITPHAMSIRRHHSLLLRMR